MMKHVLQESELRQMRRLAILLFAALSLFVGCGGQKESERADRSDPNIPFLYIRRCAALGDEEKGANGLVVALWGDGRIIRATSEQDVGSSYVEAVLKEDDLEDVLSFIGLIRDG